MFELCKLVAKKSQDISIHAGQDPSALTTDSKELSDAYCLLADETRGAIGATETDEVVMCFLNVVVFAKSYVIYNCLYVICSYIHMYIRRLLFD